MAKTGKKAPAKKNKTTNNKRVNNKRVNDEISVRNKEIMGIVIIAVSILLLLNFIVAPKEQTAEIGAFGVVSLWIVNALRAIAGHAAVIMPIFMLGFGILACAGKGREHSLGRLIGVVLIFVAVVGFFQIGAELKPFGEYVKTACTGSGGGVLGAFVDFIFLKTVGKVGACLLLVAILLIGILETFQTSLKQMAGKTKNNYKNVSESVSEKHERIVKAREERRERRAKEVEYSAPPIVEEVISKEEETSNIRDTAENMENIQEKEPVVFISEPVLPVAPPTPPPPEETPFVREYMPSISGGHIAAVSGSAYEQPATTTVTRVNGGGSQFDSGAVSADTHDDPDTTAVRQDVPIIIPDEQRESVASGKAKETEEIPPEKEDGFGIPQAPAPAETGYTLPPVELIDGGVNVKNSRMDQAISNNIGVLETTLANFGVKATVTQVVAGPSVTRYELQPAPGVKVARITSLADDIALSLAAQSVRIEAPIPGKSAIGIEVARKERDTVFFREMIDSDNFQKSGSKLTVVLGKNIGGECVVTDITKMPHLLIAGTTGSGKSVCINTIICSILYKAKPDEVKLMLIDPKKVELTTYANLPHLIAPVINDCKKASNALKWIVNEMENRYTLFAARGVKDIKGYTEACPEAPMCKIVVIIDELADLMMVAKRDVEESICRIAQLARAAGIHLVVATQRPSVDVITGLIKANIPSRIAFTVSSPVDSRTILDCGGAEKLLGNGDMLFYPVGNNKPMRIQGTFINEKDVAKLVDYCTDQAKPDFSDEAVASVTSGGKSGGDDNEELDDLFYEAGMLIINTGQASTSFLQRRLAIGNPRAARLMDVLEAKGVVGGPNGSKPREILVTLDEFEEMYG